VAEQVFTLTEPVTITAKSWKVQRKAWIGAAVDGCPRRPAINRRKS
jgi:hypothetical protein